MILIRGTDAKNQIFNRIIIVITIEYDNNNLAFLSNIESNKIIDDYT